MTPDFEKMQVGHSIMVCKVNISVELFVWTFEKKQTKEGNLFKGI